MVPLLFSREKSGQGFKWQLFGITGVFPPDPYENREDRRVFLPILLLHSIVSPD